MLTQDLEIKKSRFGKLEPELYDLLDTLTPNDTVEVAIWLVAPDDPLERPAPESAISEEEMEAKAQQRKDRLAALQEPLVRELQNMGAEITEMNGLAPVVSVRLQQNQIQAIAHRPDVDGVYLVRVNQPALDVSVPTVTAPSVWARGFTGFDRYRVADIEREGIVFDNPYLYGINRPNSCFGLDNYHATNVAGVFGSRHVTYRGVAYNETLLGASACSWSDSNLQAATQWARDNGGRSHNNSWGSNTNGASSNMSRYHDTVVRNLAVTVVDSAGNCVGGCQVIAPALAYNVIAVGAFTDNNTTSWSDDLMAGFSSYIDPTSSHGDREKPEVAAPGVNIITTNQSSPWITPSPGVSGTSFAAPHVAGGAALLMQRFPGDPLYNLAYLPEAVKAILMATAIHNIEGSSRLSEYDGAGGISLDHADRVASDTSKWKTARITLTSFDSTASINYYFTATTGQVVRAVIAWDANPSYAFYNTQPGVDLDLYVYSPSGSLVTSSLSWDNTYEIVQFTAPTTGTYRLRVYNKRFNDSSTFLGIAWANF